MTMDRYAASVLVILCLQSLCLVRGASLPVENLANIAGLSGQNRNPRLGSTKDVIFPRPTMGTCVAGMTNRSDQVYGIYARISAWGQEHIKSYSYNSAVLQVSNDEGDEFNAIRAGLHTFPRLYNDTKLHLFVQWKTDMNWGTGCYNTDCSGFLPFKETYQGVPKPGMVIEQLSSYGQSDSSVALEIVKDERPGIGGDWWLYCVVGPARYPLGRWPASLFGGLSRHGTQAPRYGAAGFEARGEPAPAMGSGHGPGEGYARAAYFADIKLVDNMAFWVEPSGLAGVLPMLTAEGRYQVAKDPDGGNTFFYGGPVTQGCDV